MGRRGTRSVQGRSSQPYEALSCGIMCCWSLAIWTCSRSILTLLGPQKDLALGPRRADTCCQSPEQPFMAGEFVCDPGESSDSASTERKGPVAKPCAEPPVHQAELGQVVGRPGAVLPTAEHPPSQRGFPFPPAKSVMKQTLGYSLLKNILFYLAHILCRSTGCQLRSCSRGDPWRSGGHCRA